MIYIYQFTNLINGKIYVGSTKDIDYRIKKHKYFSTLARCSHYAFYAATNKYGWESFMLDVIEECCPLFRNERENYWINYYHTLDNRYGYNLRTADNILWADASRKKLGDSHRGRKHTESAKQKMADASKGNKHAVGLKHTKETKDKIAEANRGKTLSDEHMNILRKPKTEEHKLKLRAAWYRRKLSGENLGMQGRKHSDETKRKIRESNIKTKNAKRKEKLEKLRAKIKKLF